MERHWLLRKIGVPAIGKKGKKIQVAIE